MKKSKRFLSLILSLILISSVMVMHSIPSEAAVKYGYVDYSYLNLRSAPTTSAKKITKLSRNDTVEILSSNKGWYRVNAFHNGKIYKGYVSSGYIHSGYAPGAQNGYVNDPALNLRKGADVSYSKITVLSKNDPVKVLQTIGKWSLVSVVHKGTTYTGYVAKRYLVIGKTANKSGAASSSPSSASSSSSKVIYLTFDDGPGPYTKKLLDILDKYNVKATFFVTNQFPKYQNMIGEEARRGHTVAVHTYTHDFASIYKSQTAFWNDIDKMNSLIKKQTGKKSDILRFPGGSSNAVSKKYCKGIMTKLTANASGHGFVYADWNVDSRDAGGTTSSSGVASNVKKGCAKQKTSVVLMHDIKSYSVNAVEDIIKWGLKNGYSFKAMTKSSSMAHHGHLNN